MVTFAEILGGEQDKPKSPRPIHEAQILELQRLYADYGNSERFKPGDLVMRRAGTATDFPDEPYIVLEILAQAPIDWSANRPGSAAHGVRLDIRVMTLASDIYQAVWLESWMFEPYQPKGAQPEEPS